MVIEVTPTEDELAQLHDELKAYETQLAAYLASDAGQKDPNYDSLAKADIKLNLQIYNLSNAQLQLAAANAGAAIDAINGAIGNLKDAIARRASITSTLAVVQSALSFVAAILTQNPSGIISAGNDFAAKLKAA